MARGTLKNVKQRGRGLKVGANGEQSLSGGGQGGALGAGGADSQELFADYFNCECLFSLILVGLLAALPFNLHCNEMFQTKETYHQKAQELFSNGAYDKAATLFERVLSSEETPEGHSALAETLVRMKRYPDALVHLDRASGLLDQRPAQGAVQTRKEVARLYLDSNRPDLAAKSFQRVLELKERLDTEEVADAYLHLARAKIEDGFYEDAIKHLEACEAMNTSQTQTIFNAQLLLANAYHDMGHVDKALSRFKKAYKTQPKNMTALWSLALVYHETGLFSKALPKYKAATATATAANNAAADVARYMSAALQPSVLDPIQPPARAPSAFVALLFDFVSRRRAFVERHGPRTCNNLTTSTESKGKGCQDPDAQARDTFGLLHQNLTQMMREMVESTLGLSPHIDVPWLDVLDLGCGTGEAGVAFKPLSNRLIGVDVSGAAVRAARGRGVYDEIWHTDISSALTSQGLEAAQDLVVLADAAPYFGSLQELFQQLSGVVRLGGLVVLNADVLTGRQAGDEGSTCSDSAASGCSYRLEFTGRWSHTSEYVRLCGLKVGFSTVRSAAVSAQQQYLRGEEGWPVKGSRPQERKTLVMVFQKVS